MKTIEKQIGTIYLDAVDFCYRDVKDLEVIVDNCKIIFDVTGEIYFGYEYDDCHGHKMPFTDDSKINIDITSFTDDKGEEFENYDYEMLEKIIKYQIEWEW